MPRLSAEQWEQARAAYEVRGVSLGEVARRFGVSDVAVGKRAKKEGWAQGKSSELVSKKVMAIKALCEVEQESSDLPQTYRTTLDDVVRERLEADHLFAKFDRALALRGLALVQQANTAEDWETLTRGRRNLASMVATNKGQGTTVNVHQQQAQVALNPRDALAELVAAEQADVQDVQ